MVRTNRYSTVDVFTSEAFGGNQLAVVLDVEMRAIVGELSVAAVGDPFGTLAPVSVFTPEPQTECGTVHSRIFAHYTMDRYPDDPATGATSGPLGAYLVRYGSVSRVAAVRIVSEQRLDRFIGRAEGVNMSGDSAGPMLDEMEHFPVRLARLLERLDDAQAGRRPAAEEWSAAEVVAHLLDTDRVYGERIARMLDEDNPFFADFDQEAAIDARHGQALPLAATFESFALERAELVARLRRIEERQWTRTGTHPVRGVGTIVEYVRTLWRHDQAHGEQIREAGGLAL